MHVWIIIWGLDLNHGIIEILLIVLSVVFQQLASDLVVDLEGIPIS